MAESDSDDVTLRTLHDDLTGGFAEMRSSLTGGFAEMRSSLTGGFAEMRSSLTGGFAEMRSGLADLQVTLVTGFRGLATRESSEEMVRLLREGNRLHEERFTQLDIRIREQHLENQQTLHTLGDGQRLLLDGQQRLVESQQRLVESQRGLSADMKALLARLHPLIRGPRHAG